MERKLEEESVRRLDFTTPELEYILANANFTVEQEEIKSSYFIESTTPIVLPIFYF